MARQRNVVRIIWALSFDCSHPRMPAIHRESGFFKLSQSATDGVVPNSELLPANPGFYGVTREGGAHGFGTVFLVTPQAGGGNNWNETILYSFAGSGDGAFPSGGLVADQAGNLYGATLVGGANDLGAVYQLSPPATEGGAWTETVIFSFSGTDGTLPFGRLQFDETGALYGTTTSGGSGQAGTVFQILPQSRPGVRGTKASFTTSPEGGMRVTLSRESSSTTGADFLEGLDRRAGPSFPGGVIFRLLPPVNEGDPWTETVLRAFGGPDGFRPLSRLVPRGGSFYGTTSSGGLNGTGTVFILTP